MIPRSRRTLREGNGNPLQFSCPGNLMTEETGGLQSVESQRIRHDLAIKPPPPPPKRERGEFIFALFFWSASWRINEMLELCCSI